jgi:hypothetical protein
VSSFSLKSLRVTFTLTNSNAKFPGTEANTLQLTGLRMSAVIQGAGLPAFPEASLRIYGMSQSDMNALAIVHVQGGKPQYSRNVVTIEADSGDGRGYNFVFAGNIYQAGPDYTDPPNVSLFVHAQVGGFDQLNIANPTSYPVGTPVATIVANIAAKMSFVFENDGVTAIASGNPYYSGALTNQLRKVCTQYNILYGLEPPNLLTISPMGVPRTLPIFTLSPTSGLIGYPEVLGNGYIKVRALFNPAFRQNGPLTIANSGVVIDLGLESTTNLNSLADGNWIIGPLQHVLECLKPSGAWFTEMTLYPINALPAAA